MSVKEYIKLILSFWNEAAFRKAMSLMIVCQLCCSVARCLSANSIGKAVDNIDGNLVFTLIILSILAVFISVSSLLVEYYREKIKTQHQGNLRNELLQGIFRFDNNEIKDSHGELYETVITQVSEFTYDIWQTVLKVTEITISVLATLVISFAINKKISLAMLITSPVLTFLTIKSMGIASKTHIKRQTANRKYVGLVSEIVSLIKEIRILPIRELFIQKQRASENSKYAADRKHKQAVLICRSVEKIAYVLGYLQVLLMGVIENAKGNITIGQILALMCYSSILLEQLAQLNYVYDMYISNRGLYEHMRRFLTSKDKPIGDTFIADKITQIDIQNLCYGFSNTKVLNEVSVILSPGTITSVQGPSGSGKSTFLKILLKQLNGATGTIFINNVDIKQISEKCIRSKIAYLAQRPFIFDGTVYENITWAVEKADVATVKQMLNEIGLEKLDIYEAIGENGANLSGGERQRLAFARCMLKKSDIIILDEPFSQLDEVIENRIIKILQKQENKIILLTTHRHTVNAIADQIVTL